MVSGNGFDRALKPGPDDTPGDLLPQGYFWAFDGAKREYRLHREGQQRAVAELYKGFTIERDYIFSRTGNQLQPVRVRGASGIHEARQIAECMIATGVIEL